MTSKEKEFAKAVEKASREIYSKEIDAGTRGTKENPYIYLTSQELYDKMKEIKLIDDNDMYTSYCGWTKVYVVKPLSQEYEQLKLKV